MSVRKRLEEARTEELDGAFGEGGADSFDDELRAMAHVPTPRQAGPLALTPGTLVAGRFRVERMLGQGGMGAVYAVRHEHTRHLRALKLLHPERSQNPEIVQRFLAEASAAGRTDNAHLVETYDAGILPSGGPYLVMEHLQGLTFADLIADQGQLSPELACELVAQAAEGIAAAHEAHIIHRDLKPDNLFIVQRPDGPFVKILDFGISKFMSESLAHNHMTHPDAIIGTPAYMAPEQLQSARDVDERADVFALGAVLFECLGGEAPFEAPSLPALVAHILAGQSTPLETLRPDLPEALYAVVRRAMATDPAARTPTARTLLGELASFRKAGTPSFRALAGDPPPEDDTSEPASPPPPRSQRTRRVAVGVVLAVCVVTAILAAVQASTTWTSREAETHAAPSSAPAGAESLSVPNEKRSVVAAPSLAAEKDAQHGAAPSVEEAERVEAASAGRRGAHPQARRTARPPPPTPGPVRSRAEELGLSNENPFR